jgi:hypothetical protein
MLDQVSPRRGALELYIDAGPLARDIGYALGRVRLPEIPLVLAAGALLGVALAGLDTSLGSRQVLFATVGAVVVITGPLLERPCPRAIRLAACPHLCGLWSTPSS